uniref:CD276 antigen-like n=1 Tax=Epinephelus lanceolatus TaxID=310571 RepID=UPI0014471D7A
FDWKKAAQKDGKNKEVFFYDAGITYNNGRSGQSEEFKGRVFHFPKELKHGNASIIIRNTKMADSGDYTCVFPHLQPRQTFHIKLVVGAAREPSVKTLNQTNNWALLQCVVRDASPKPKVEWKDSSGNKLHAEEPQVIDRGGSYDIILQTTVTKTDHYQCVVAQEEINHQVSAETYVHFSGPTPAKVEEGSNAILPCLLSTKKNIGSEMFEWKKDGLKEVFFYGGINYNSNRPGQSEEFQGRVSHFPHKLKHGDASITIRNAKMADSGIYTCDFPRLQPRQIFHIELDVGDIYGGSFVTSQPQEQCQPGGR